jgi:hypothetical protein
MHRERLRLPDLLPLRKGGGFSSDRFRSSECDFASRWSIVYDTLRSLCRQQPRHTARNVVAAKVWIIGRTYATQIERRVESSGGQGSSLDQVVTLIHKNADAIDKWIDRIPERDEATLDDGAISDCIHAHGGLVSLLKKITKEKAPRSFASKYLHFHRPAMPIYDSVASQVLSKLVRWRAQFDCGSLGEPEDGGYREFVMHLRQLNGLAAQTGLHPSVRALDWSCPRTWCNRREQGRERARFPVAP